MTATGRPAQPAASPETKLSRQIGCFDATMLVMGGIVGAGIFINPYVVARQVHTPWLILGAWIAGGVIAMLGAIVYAELGDRMPDVGGQYAYLRAAFHPAVGFAYGWVLLLVIQTGGMAAVTVTFARYFLQLTGWAVPEKVIGVTTLLALTLVNCLGVKPGTRLQSVLMVCKIVAIAALVIVGFSFVQRPFPLAASAPVALPPLNLLSAFGAALVPVMFAYGGYQTANFVAGEIKDPARNLSRALVVGVAGVVVLYAAVNIVMLHTLGAEGLANTTVPATEVMRTVLGHLGVRFIALAIALSSVGFLSQSILTAPRVYFAMAEDGLFFRAMAWVHPATRVPVIAIVVQSVWTAIILLTGRYEQILNYVISMDLLFMALTASCLFIFRRRDRAPKLPGRYRTPGHPFTTAAFILAASAVVLTTIYKYPANTLIGFVILAMGYPAYLFWRKQQQAAAP